MLEEVVSFWQSPEEKSPKELTSKDTTEDASLWLASLSKTLMTLFFLKG